MNKTIQKENVNKTIQKEKACNLCFKSWRCMSGNISFVESRTICMSIHSFLQFLPKIPGAIPNFKTQYKPLTQQLRICMKKTSLTLLKDRDLQMFTKKLIGWNH